MMKVMMKEKILQKLIIKNLHNSKNICNFAA